MPWPRAGVRSEAGSPKIPQDQLICSEPMCDKKTLRVTDTTEANTKFKFHGLQTAVKDTVCNSILSADSALVDACTTLGPPVPTNMDMFPRPNRGPMKKKNSSRDLRQHKKSGCALDLGLRGGKVWFSSVQRAVSLNLELN